MAGPHFPLGTAPRKVLQYDAVNSEVDFVVDLVPVTCGPEKGKTLWDVYAYTKANCIFSVQPLLTTWIQNSGFCGTYCSHTPHSMLSFLFGIHFQGSEGSNLPPSRVSAGEAIACLASHHFYTDQPELALRFYRRMLQNGVVSAVSWSGGSFPPRRFCFFWGA